MVTMVTEEILFLLWHHVTMATTWKFSMNTAQLPWQPTIVQWKVLLCTKIQQNSLCKTLYNCNVVRSCSFHTESCGECGKNPAKHFLDFCYNNCTCTVTNNIHVGAVPTNIENEVRGRKIVLLKKSWISQIASNKLEEEVLDWPMGAMKMWS